MTARAVRHQAAPAATNVLAATCDDTPVATANATQAATSNASLASMSYVAPAPTSIAVTASTTNATPAATTSATPDATTSATPAPTTSAKPAPTTIAAPPPTTIAAPPSTTTVVDVLSTTIIDTTTTSTTTTQVSPIAAVLNDTVGGCSQLLATAPSSLANECFLDDMLGFTNLLIPKPKDTVLFDPSANPSSSELDSDDGISFFQKKAISNSLTNRCELGRTRSQSKSLEAGVSLSPEPTRKKSAAKAVKIKKGDLVYGHKGKIIPCWFPGTVVSIGKKGTLKVKFLAEFGQADCVSSNVMLFGEYATRKKTDVNKALFEVPKKISLNFKEAQQQAELVLLS